MDDYHTPGKKDRDSMEQDKKTEYSTQAEMNEQMSYRLSALHPTYKNRNIINICVVHNTRR